MTPAGSSRRLAWALLLALLLPLAQAVAANHTITHHSPAQQRDTAPSALDAKCAQCLQIAPLGAGALPCAPTPALASDTTQAGPTAPALPDPESARALAYRSRAPPTTLS